MLTLQQNVSNLHETRESTSTERPLRAVVSSLHDRNVEHVTFGVSVLFGTGKITLASEERV